MHKFLRIIYHWIFLFNICVPQLIVSIKDCISKTIDNRGPLHSHFMFNILFLNFGQNRFCYKHIFILLFKVKSSIIILSKTIFPQSLQSWEGIKGESVRKILILDNTGFCSLVYVIWYYNVLKIWLFKASVTLGAGVMWSILKGLILHWVLWLMPIVPEFGSYCRSVTWVKGKHGSYSKFKNSLNYTGPKSRSINKSN